MKLFFYKSILIVFFFLIAFHFSFNYAYKKIKTELNNNLSKDNIERIKNKIRSVAENAANKDVYIRPDDAKIINNFLNKIKKDLKQNN